MRIGKANVSASSLIDAHTARLHRALSCAVFDATSWRAPRSGGRRAPKGLIPFGNPQCEKVAPLSLCSSFRKMIHLQTLRARVQKTRAHFGANIFAFDFPAARDGCRRLLYVDKRCLLVFAFAARRASNGKTIACLQQKQNLWILFRKGCKYHNAFW